MGKPHPISETLDRVIDYFVLENGYELYLDNHEILSTRESFDDTGIGTENTVRDRSRTFYVDDEYILRGHMTSIRKKILDSHAGQEIAVVFPGRVYRVVHENNTHHSVSHQVEMVVTRGPMEISVVISMLQGLYYSLFSEYSHYTTDFTVFTSPTVQFYLPCWECGGKGCSCCYHRGELTWAAGGIYVNEDGKRVLSFSLSLDRIAMKRWGITNCRVLYNRGKK